MHRTGLVIFDGVTLLDVGGPAEVLSRVPQFTDGGYEQRLLSLEAGAVPTAAGIPLTTDGPPGAGDRFDTLIVAGGERLVAERIEPELLALVERAAARSRRVASVCTGAFLLAEVGLLDGRRATTHWRHAATLARRYPSIDVVDDAISVADGAVHTSAGVSAGIDLALALVESDHGSAVARAVARELVVFLQRPGGQSQFSVATSSPAPRRTRLPTTP